jgi:hypothetical protein
MNSCDFTLSNCALDAARILKVAFQTKQYIAQLVLCGHRVVVGESFFFFASRIDAVNQATCLDSESRKSTVSEIPSNVTSRFSTKHKGTSKMDA